MSASLFDITNYNDGWENAQTYFLLENAKSFKELVEGDVIYYYDTLRTTIQTLTIRKKLCVTRRNRRVIYFKEKQPISKVDLGTLNNTGNSKIPEAYLVYKGDYMISTDKELMKTHLINSFNEGIIAKQNEIDSLMKRKNKVINL
jgi:hypothetical protein